MIQRIQSLYLMLVPIVILCMFMIPLSSFQNDIGVFTLKMTGFFQEGYRLHNGITVWYIIPLAGIVTALTAMVSIFLFRNRRKQIMMNRITLILAILFIASIFYVTDRTSALEGVYGYAYNIGAYLSLLPVILIYLANGRIRRDEMKVRAADRIR